MYGANPINTDVCPSKQDYVAKDHKAQPNQFSVTTWHSDGQSHFYSSLLQVHTFRTVIPTKAPTGQRQRNLYGSSQTECNLYSVSSRTCLKLQTQQEVLEQEASNKDDYGHDTKRNQLPSCYSKTPLDAHIIDSYNAVSILSFWLEFSFLLLSKLTSELRMALLSIYAQTSAV